MSSHAHRINAAHRAYRDAIGTPREDAAYTALRLAVRQIPRPAARHCLMPSSTEMDRVG
jgi:hypothetical protein